MLQKVDDKPIPDSSTYSSSYYRVSFMWLTYQQDIDLGIFLIKTKIGSLKRVYLICISVGVSLKADLCTVHKLKLFISCLYHIKKVRIIYLWLGYMSTKLDSMGDQLVLLCNAGNEQSPFTCFRVRNNTMALFRHLELWHLDEKVLKILQK